MTELFRDLPVGGTISGNHLFYGDNLTIMRGMPDQCVDLIYLDPPFNSQRNYNLIYKQATGLPVPEQAIAFCDAWELDAEKDQLARDLPSVLAQANLPGEIVAFWTAWIQALRGTQPRLLAYLVYMTYRLVEMRRLLKKTGSIYLHCDPTASHYIKIIMDGVFGHENFRSEIVWRRSNAHNKLSKQFGPIHDVILFYSNSSKFHFFSQKTPYRRAYIEEAFRSKDARGSYQANNLTGPGIRNGISGSDWEGYNPTKSGRHWALPAALKAELPQALQEAGLFAQFDWLLENDWIVLPAKQGGQPRYKQYPADGVPLQDIWAYQPNTRGVLHGTDNNIDEDVKWLDDSKERLGYPTQKPIGLLSRIIKTSCPEDGVVFDPFAGCGTSIYAAQINRRRWIGCDIAILSVSMVRDVLARRYGLVDGLHYRVSGVPVSEEGARKLFAEDPHQFQNWAVEAVGGFCSMKRSNDRGIDGRLWFETKEGLRSMVLEVKGGKLKPEFTRALTGVLARDPDALLAGLICLEPPTPGMLRDVADAGVLNYQGKNYPRLQIRTVAQLLDGRNFETPSVVQTMERERQSILPLQGRHQRQTTLDL